MALTIFLENITLGAVQKCANLVESDIERDVDTTEKGPPKVSNYP